MLDFESVGGQLGLGLISPVRRQSVTYLLMVTYGPLLSPHDTAIIDDDWKGCVPSHILLWTVGTT